jgi:hypothetical protein
VRARLAAVAFVALAGGCGGHHGAPNVKGKPFPAALARLRAAGWLVSVPSFPRIDGNLEDYRVVGQRTTARRTVTLEVGEAPVRVVVMTLGTPPPLPGLVGQTYRNASRVADRNARLLVVRSVAALSPSASLDGIDAFVVLSQREGSDRTVVVRLGERPCWKSVIQDWYVDQVIDGVYFRRCYREALDEIPLDLPYSRLPQLLRERLR